MTEQKDIFKVCLEQFLSLVSKAKYFLSRLNGSVTQFDEFNREYRLKKKHQMQIPKMMMYFFRASLS